METTALPLNKWNIAQKILFRFFAAYIFCYIGLQEIMELSGKFFYPLIRWTGKSVLHISYPITIMPNGSGDTTYNYVQEFLFFAISLISCMIWSVTDRRRSSYNKMLYWVQVLVRYYLAYVLLSYGYSKLFRTQFPAPDLQRLTQQYGKSSPMGLAWTFLGFSAAFNYFMGFFEAIGGVLMIFRRTTLFGACIAATVITNIVLINFCYDVPVKLFSSNLLLLTLFIIVCDSRRFLNFFMFNRAVPPADHSIFSKNRTFRISRIVVKSLFIIWAVGLMGYESMDMKRYYAGYFAKPPLYGVYDIQTFVYRNDTLLPVKTDTVRWGKLAIFYTGYATIYKMNDSTSIQVCNIDTNDHTMIIPSFENSNDVFNVTYAKNGKDELILRGRIINSNNSIKKCDSIYIKMKRFDEHQFLLMNRGFHWINEYPMNR